MYIWRVYYFSIYTIQLKKRRERRGGEGESYVKEIKFDIKWYKYRVNRTADKSKGREQQITT